MTQIRWKDFRYAVIEFKNFFPMHHSTVIKRLVCTCGRRELYQRLDFSTLKCPGEEKPSDGINSEKKVRQWTPYLHVQKSVAAPH